MTNDTHLLALPIPSAASAVSYNGLPDEAAVHYVAELHARATATGQPFRLLPLDNVRHPRGLCVGLTPSEQPIAIFYLSEAGDYGWCALERLHILPVMLRHLVAPSVEIGMLYWFRASGHGPGHIQAESVGTVGPLKSHYIALHTPTSGKSSPKKTKAGDDETGAPPALHPPNDDAGFVALKSLDELGL